LIAYLTENCCGQGPAQPCCAPAAASELPRKSA